MATRYFQHLNPQDKDFQKVTELREIDDTDPNFILYYFKDGSKCNKDFIGELNEKDVYGRREFTEVSHPNNAWEFEIVEIKHEKQYALNANGERVEIADYLDRGDKPIKEGKRIKVKKAPEFMLPTNSESPKKVSYDFNQDAETVANDTKDKEYKPEIQLYNVDKNPNEEVSYIKNGNIVKTTISELLQPKVEVVEKIVEKVVEKEVGTGQLISIDISDDQRSLIENMIGMSQKDSCSIEMELTLKLPPIQVYNLINSVYPAGMSDAFVNIIANSMDITQLRESVAAGLKQYYDTENTQSNDVK